MSMHPQNHQGYVRAYQGSRWLPHLPRSPYLISSQCVGLLLTPPNSMTTQASCEAGILIATEIATVYNSHAPAPNQVSLLK